MHHSCGAIKSVIPDLIEAGVEILNPVQPTAKDMEPDLIKKSFGDKITFCGGIDMINALQGTEEDMRKEIQLRIAQMGPGGGFMLAPSNHIQRDVPPENVVRFFELAKHSR